MEVLRSWRSWAFSAISDSSGFTGTRKPTEQVESPGSEIEQQQCACTESRVSETCGSHPGQGQICLVQCLTAMTGAQSRHYESYSWVADGQIDSGLVQTSFQPSLFTASGREVAMTQRQQQTRKPLQIQCLPCYPTMDGTASPESSQRLRNRHELVEHAQCKDTLTRFLLVSISTCVPAMNTF